MTDERMNTYTRITTILSMYSDYDKIPPLVLAKAAKRGTEIHKLCEVYAEEGIHIPSEHDGYLQGFIKWFDSEVGKLRETETRLFDDDLEITGQFDLLVTLKGGDDLIVDIKTCVAKHDTWPLQLAAYQYLYEVNHVSIAGVEKKLPYKAVLHLKKDGKYEFYVYPNDKKDTDLFMSALKLHRFFKKD